MKKLFLIILALSFALAAQGADTYESFTSKAGIKTAGTCMRIYKDGDKNLPFANDDYVFIPGIRKMVEEKLPSIKAYAVKKDGTVNEFELSVGDLTDDERKIILSGCLINFYRN